MDKITARYHVLQYMEGEKDGEGALIFDARTGRVQDTFNWQEIMPYYNYLVEKNRIDEAQRLLAECMDGNEPTAGSIAKMCNSSPRALSA